MRSYADSLCPTCRINLFHVDRGGPSVSKSHFHSQDEIIHVLTGEIQVGRDAVSAGMSIAIPANVRYGFRAKDPFTFLNYRRDASYVTYGTSSARVLESVAAVEAD